MKINITFPLLALGLLVFTTFILTGQITRTQTIKSKADKIQLSPPYIKLYSPPGKHNTGDTIPIDIFVNTAGLKSLESRFVVTYNESLLTINEADIINKGVYPVINIESISNGTLIFSVFTKDESGYGPVSLSTEKKVSTLNFKAKERGGTNIELVVKNGENTSSISSVRYSPDQPADNILNSTQNTYVNIE